MSKLNRQRGASYEREVANAIFDQLGIRIRRNLKQYQVSDEGDLILGKYLIECKRRRKIAVYDFMEQAEKACEIGQIPLVIMREDGNKSLAMLRLPDLLTLLGNERDPGNRNISLIVLLTCIRPNHSFQNVKCAGIGHL